MGTKCPNTLKLYTTNDKTFHVIVKANSIIKLVIQIKNGIVKHVNVNLKIISAKNIILGILAHVLLRIANI